jgi:2-polyprenyl-3-methyl-5-hydroxy-6-metoxy-1,4-benzoquinol methylase
MKSKITGGDVTYLFNATVLNKYDVKYFRCNDTGFIQTEDPYWLDESYSSAIASLDVGLVMRNLNLVADTEPMINDYFNFKGKFLDFAGGYGLFTRLMRDKGFDFYHTDKYCENIFAQYFDIKDTPQTNKFELLTAFEVFEHLNDPMPEIAELFKYSDNILFSTESIPEKEITSAKDWWYFVPEIGQHIAFYSKKSLEYIAAKNNAHLYTNNSTLHLFTKKQLPVDPFVEALKPKEPYLIRKIQKKIRKKYSKNVTHPSLLDHDSNHIKSIMFNKNQ